MNRMRWFLALLEWHKSWHMPIRPDQKAIAEGVYSRTRGGELVPKVGYSAEVASDGRLPAVYKPKHDTVVVTGGNLKPQTKRWAVTIEPEDARLKVTECGFKPLRPVVISSEVFAKIRAMMKHFSNTEWLGWFIANESGVMVDMIIPSQEGRGGKVDVKPPKDMEESDARSALAIAGVIHSHHHMTAFHSGTDDQHLVHNHPVSIVVAFAKQGNGFDYDAIRSEDLPCGARIERKVQVVVEDDPIDPEWVKMATGQVEVNPAWSGGYHGGNYGTGFKPNPPVPGTPTYPGWKVPSPYVPDVIGA